MKRAKAVLAAAMVIPLAGCALTGKTKTVPAPPAAPQPAAPTPPPQPLSIPQTQVQLPEQQPVVPAALETAPHEAIPQVQAKSPSPQTRPRGNTSTAPKPADTQAAAPETAPEPAVEPTRAPVHEIIPETELNRLREDAKTHRSETSRLLSETRARTPNQRRARDEINQFLKQSQDAEASNDMRLAEQLAERAHILAKELQSGK